MRSLLLALLVGCVSPGVDDPSTNQTRVDTSTPTWDAPLPEVGRVGDAPASGVATTLADGGVLIADPDSDSLLHLARDAAEPLSLPLGEDPTRVLRVDDVAYVTVRGAGQLAAVSLEPEPTLVGTADVGAEPFDVRMHDGRLYVSLSQEGAVVALDPADLSETARYAVGGEPRWLQPVGEVLYVARVDRPVVVGIDLTSGATWEHALPELDRFTDHRCVQRPLAARISGGMAHDPDTHALFVPTFYADVQLAELDANLEGDAFTRCGELDLVSASLSPGSQEERPPPYYAPPVPADSPAKVDRNNGTVVVLSLASDGASRVLGLPVADPDGVVVRGVPGDVTLGTLDGTLTAWVPIGSHGRLLAVQPDGARTPETAGALDLRFRGVVDADLGVSTVLLHEDTLITWSRIRGTVRRGPVTTPDPSQVAPRVHRAVLPSALPDDVQRGRVLFHTSVDRRIVAGNAGAACANCHAEGRTDGFTWQFADMPRQTPSLAGDIAATAPVTWLGSVETVEDEIHATSRERMGGTGLDADDAAALAAFVAHVRPVRRPTREPDLVATGRAAFQRAGCADCHVEGRTDRSQHAVLDFGVATDTPTLQGIGATAPYLHDGSAPTLRDVLLRAGDGSMGDTSGLTEAELDALVAYLERL